jgi:hypothetical protein
LRVGIIGARNNINVANLREFLSVAIPIFERFFAPIMVHIAGSVCDWFQLDDARFIRRIGRVESVADFYRSIDVACIPLRSSTGIKIKTGEALSFGLPIVSHAHAFEGYAACHPFHTMADFNEMAYRLVEIAFDREQLSELRAASGRAAIATKASIASTIAKSWHLVKQRRRAIVYCVAATAFSPHAAERCAFLSTLEYLTSLADVVVLIVAGPVEALLGAGSELESRARFVVASPLVAADDQLATALRDRGYENGEIDKTLDRFAQTLVVVDAFSELLTGIGPFAGRAIFRAELIAQTSPVEPQLPAITTLLKAFSYSVVSVAHASACASVLSAESAAEIVTMPCCWRSVEVNRLIPRQQQPTCALVLSDGRVRGLAALTRLLDQLDFKPILVVPLGVDVDRFVESQAKIIVARDLILALSKRDQKLPGIALDLSFGALGLQYVRELLLRLNVPMITADTDVLHPSIVSPRATGRACTYEGIAAKILMAVRDHVRPGINDDEIQQDDAWTWLRLYGFDTLQ